jgi:methionine-gamma-lyase
MPEDGSLAKKQREENRKKWDELSFETRILRAGEDPFPETINSLRPPIYQTKSFAYSSLTELAEGRYSYTRTENPTLYALDDKLAALHGGEAAVTVASGMAAVHVACSSYLQTRLERKSPDHVKKYMPQNNPERVPNIVFHTNQYTGTFRLFTKLYPQIGVEPRIIDMTDLSAVEAAVDDNTKFVFVETPANPNVDVLDIQALAEIAHSRNAKCIVDNTFASPVLTRPLEWGADLVVESLTKFINGHGDSLGGVVVGPEKQIQNIRYFWLELQGAVMSPFNAWLILRGMRTLNLRMERHSATALQLASFLEHHPRVTSVMYPGLESHPHHDVAKKQMSAFGGMIGFEVASEEVALKFIDRLKLIKVGVSLGDTTSLMQYTALMTGVTISPRERRVMRVSNTQFRFSVGLEAFEDLRRDLDQALSA